METQGFNKIYNFNKYNLLQNFLIAGFQVFSQRREVEGSFCDECNFLTASTNFRPLFLFFWPQWGKKSFRTLVLKTTLRRTKVAPVFFFFCFSQLLTEFFFLVKASFYWRGPKICADVWQPWWPPKFQEFWGWPEKRNGDGKPLFWVIKYFERSNILTLTPFWKWALQKLVHILSQRGNHSKLKCLLCRSCICIREHNEKIRRVKMF